MATDARSPAGRRSAPSHGRFSSHGRLRLPGPSKPHHHPHVLRRQGRVRISSAIAIVLSLRKVFFRSNWMAATFESLKVAVATTMLSVLLGVGAAYGADAKELPGQQILDALSAVADVRSRHRRCARALSVPRQRASHRHDLGAHGGPYGADDSRSSSSPRWPASGTSTATWRSRPR